MRFEPSKNRGRTDNATGANGTVGGSRPKAQAKAGYRKGQAKRAHRKAGRKK